MPGVERLTIPALVDAAAAAAELGIPAVALFPVVPLDRKDEAGSESCNPDNLCNRAVRAIKEAVPDIGVVCDVALDPYTSHGHDGLIADGRILRSEEHTSELQSLMRISYAVFCLTKKKYVTPTHNMTQ